MARKSVIDMSEWQSLDIEGNLISPAKIEQVFKPDDNAETRDSYCIRKGLTVREEISTAFRVGQNHFDNFDKNKTKSLKTTQRFVRNFLKETFGFDDIEMGKNAVSFVGGGRVPIVVAPPSDENLDRYSQTLSKNRTHSPAFILQDYLNEHKNALWGLVTNGILIRLMRHNASLTRPAYIEANLEHIFKNEDAASFTALWLLIHRSRFGSVGKLAADCYLERWREDGVREGEVARDKLSGQVQQALKVFGSGFLEANPDLVEKIQSGEIDRKEWFNELLRLVYRLIFLMVAEDRNLLHPEGAKPEARELYKDGYGLAMLRDQCYRSTTWDKHFDRFEGIKVVFRSLAHPKGEAYLALPHLGSLFSENNLPYLEEARLRNRALMEGLYHLSWLSGSSGKVRVNWRLMETEELGSVYESLLELEPQICDGGKSLTFALEASEQRGNQRRTTGSYYTPDSLVQALLETTLEPVLKERLASGEGDSDESLLSLSVIDPACGSGHFLLAAARRIATHVAHARLEQGDNIRTSSGGDFRRALRDVSRRCIYGVDKNPMAVELAKVALWIETVDPGLPLGFFDSQIKCGDSLLGVFKHQDLGVGIPDSAYKNLTGDDRIVARDYLRANRASRDRQGSLDFADKVSETSVSYLAENFTDFRALSENTVEEVDAKERRYKELCEKKDFVRLCKASDLYIGAFLLPKQESGLGASARSVPISEDIWTMCEKGVCSPLLEKAINVARRACAFHWHLEFPDVMKRGGFDVVLSNPPWERVKLQQQEFFATRDPEITKARNAAIRNKMVNQLAKSNPPLAREWQSALRTAAAISHFIRSSGRFPRGGVGDVNTYAAFTDLAWQLIHPAGRAGVIVPNGLVAGFTYREFLQQLLTEQSLVSFYGFENGAPIFKDVHPQTRFGLLTITGKDIKTKQPWFTAYIQQPAEIDDPKRRYTLTVDEIRVINPNTLNLPAFQWKKDAKVTVAIHTVSPVLIEKKDGETVRNDWQIEFQRTFHMANDSGFFINYESVEPFIYKQEGAEVLLEDEEAILQYGKRLFPLYEGKMLWHFDHRYGTYEEQTEAQANQGVLPKVSDEQHSDPNYRIQPRYWIDSKLTLETLKEQKGREWNFAWRRIGPSERTFIGTAIPRTAVSDSAFVLYPNRKNSKENIVLVALLSSFVCDYAARKKAPQINYFVVEQLPILSPNILGHEYNFLGATATDWLAERVLELCYTNNEMVGLAKDMKREHGPFPWSPGRRVILQAEINAAMFHLYRLDRTQAEWILDSFTVLRRCEERDYSEFRTKRLILAAYDVMAKAKELGSVYISPLNPLPADPSLCHSNK